MQIVKSIADARVCDRAGVHAFELCAGESYVLHDEEAGLGLRDGAVELVESLDRRLSHYLGQALTNERLLLSFIGRGGDALVTASCLEALLEAYPNIRVDISCRAEAAAVFSLTPQVGRVVAYPPLANDVDRYDYYMCFEGIESVSNGKSRSCRTVFSACLHTPLPKKPASIVVPDGFQNCWLLPDSSRPRVGLALGNPDSLRSYPMSACGELAELLVDAGYDVYLLGGRDISREMVRACFPDAAYVSHADGLREVSPADTTIDLVGSTSTPADLAAVMSQMDVVVTSDSFPMHLSGSIGKPTVAVFTVTDSVLASDYASVIGVSSQLDCSPCGQAQGPCPLGHSRCIAHDDVSVSPQMLISYIKATRADSVFALPIVTG